MLTRFLRADGGFTMVPMMGALLVLLTLTAVALGEVDNDTRLTQGDRERKQALAAAEAGVQDYLVHLKQNSAYWQLCSTPGNPGYTGAANASLNPRRTSASQLRWGNLDGSSAQFAVEILPANGAAQCVVNDETSVVDKDTGALRIRVTGRPRSGSTVTRTLVTSIRPRGFLNFVYWTDFESGDPLWLNLLNRTTREDPRPDGRPQRDVVTWGYDECARYHHASPSPRDLQFRGTGPSNGRRQSDGTWVTHTDRCDEIRFTTGDGVNGPMHTNDQILVCGTPTFGRTGRSVPDPVELGGRPGWRPCSNDGTSQPVVYGDLEEETEREEMPASNTSLRNDARDPYRFFGRTKIVFSGNTMTVTNLTTKVVRTLTPPSGTVIYVANDPASTQPCGSYTYTPLKPYDEPAGCGNVYVSGRYNASLTIGAENDIVVRDHLDRGTSGAMLGLISNNWIRVWHPITATYNTAGELSSCANDTGMEADGVTPKYVDNMRIDAAILSLNHSFTVDGYFCGAKLGTLRVRGAIAQRYRGPVGTNGSGGTGYLKDYQYDDRLRYRSPPRFMTPVNGAWRVGSVIEQVPALR